jgi:uncharacterized protein YggE
MRVLPLLAAAVLTVLPMNLHAEDMKPQMSMTGEGRMSVAPDMAQVSVGVVTQGRTAKEAGEANARAMSVVINALKADGIAARDIGTANYSIQPVYTQPTPNRSEPPRITGYQVSNTVMVRIRDLAKVGDVLDKVVASGSNQVYGIDFQISDMSTKLDQARVAAVEDARRKADLYAKAAGLKLGRIVALTEGSDGAPPVPRPMMRSAMAESAAPPIEAGERDLSVSVRITWELLP